MDIQLKIMLIAVFVQVGLTLWATLATGLSRNKALKTTDLRVADIALSKTPYPDFVQKQQNNLQNQFETPPMLYAAVAIAAGLGLASWTMAIAAVAYVAFRFWHRKIHVTHNHVMKRFTVFTYGVTALTTLWLALVYEVLIL